MPRLPGRVCNPSSLLFSKDFLYTASLRTGVSDLLIIAVLGLYADQVGNHKIRPIPTVPLSPIRGCDKIIPNPQVSHCHEPSITFTSCHPVLPLRLLYRTTTDHHLTTHLAIHQHPVLQHYQTFPTSQPLLSAPRQLSTSFTFFFFK